MKVWRRLVRIQREFLWGEMGGGTKISWVKWSKVCQPKDKGGLGIRDIRLVNLSLLAKWRWRIIQGEDALWKEVLKEKYGAKIGDLMYVKNVNWPRYVSKWWKDIVTIDERGGASWFNVEVTRRVHNGQNTSFWNTKWRGEMILSFKYPRLFAISNQKDAKVTDMWRDGGSDPDWNFNWRRRLFVWEDELLNNLLLDLHGFEVSLEEDVWCWKLEKGGCFTVSFIYKKLAEASLAKEVWGEAENRVFAQIWKSPTPSKVVALSWKGLLNRVPTTGNLLRRNALPPNASPNCVLCNEAVESANHLFLHCFVTWKIWVKLQSWLEVNVITPSNLFSHWRCWDGQLSNWKELKRGMRLIWHTAIWTIWNCRNNIIFKNGGVEVEEVVEDIKMLSWKWLKIQPCLYYEW